MLKAIAARQCAQTVIQRTVVLYYSSPKFVGFVCTVRLSSTACISGHVTLGHLFTRPALGIVGNIQSLAAVHGAGTLSRVGSNPDDDTPDVGWAYSVFVSCLSNSMIYGLSSLPFVVHLIFFTYVVPVCQRTSLA